MDFPALLMDLYLLSAAYACVKDGHADREAVFHLFFRNHPFGGGISVASGLESAVELLKEFRFESEDLEYLSTLKGSDREPLFDNDFLFFLGDQGFACSVDAVPEGSVVFSMEPILRVEGPWVQALLLETALLNILNFQTLIATKAARACLAAQGDPVIECSLRSAQGPDGGLSASRAAYIGGCAGTSNLLAGKKYRIPLMGMQDQKGGMAFDAKAAESGETSMGGVFQPSLIADEQGIWKPSMHGTEAETRHGPPGILQVRRFRWGNVFAGDMVYDTRFPIPDQAVLMDSLDGKMRKRIPAEATWEDLLVPVFRRGELVWEKPTLESSRERTIRQLEGLHPGTKLLQNPYRYPVGLEPSLNLRHRRTLIESRLRSEEIFKK